MLALLGALREEILGLQRRMVLEEASVQEGCRVFRGRYKNKAILLVQTGVGKERAETATKFILEHYPVTALVSLGFAGALTEESKVGDIILCATLYCGNGQIDGEPWKGSLCSDTSLVSLASQGRGVTAVRFCQGSSVTVAQPVSKVAARCALGKAFHADIVDMESYWIARIASAKQVPFIAIRAISDTMQDNLPPFDQILDSNGKWCWNKAVPYFVSHPQHLIKLFTLYRNARQARRSLTTSIDRQRWLLEQQDLSEETWCMSF